MYRIENSPEFEAQMKKWRKEEEQRRKKASREWEKARAAWVKAGRAWMPMATCPFLALEDRYRLDGAVLVSDGENTALATVKRRFGRPIFFKKQPEPVYRDGMIFLDGGEVDPRDDLPKWWWEWELTDEFGSMTYAGGEETGKEEVDFVPTYWTFLPEAPKS